MTKKYVPSCTRAKKTLNVECFCGKMYMFVCFMKTKLNIMYRFVAFWY